MDLNLTVFYKLLETTKDGVLEDFVDRLESTKQDEYLLHLEMLIDEGYIKGARVTECGDKLLYGFTYPRLTQSGFQMYDGLKDMSIVKSITEKAKKIGSTLTLAFAKSVIDALVKEML